MEEDLTYLAGGSQPVRSVDDAESLLRRGISSDYVSQRRAMPTPAAFRDDEWEKTRERIRDEVYVSRPLDYEGTASRYVEKGEGKREYLRRLDEAKKVREISTCLAKDLRKPLHILLVDGDHRSCEVLEVRAAGIVRQGAQLAVEHRPEEHNSAHACIVGDYEKKVSYDGAVMDARRVLVLNARVLSETEINPSA